MECVTLGVTGCGITSDVYFEAGNRFDALNITACANLDVDRAEVKAGEYDVPRVPVTEDLLAGPAVDVAVVPTPAGAHGDLVSAALRVGKHVYTEKPLAAAKAEGRAILKTTDERGLTVGVAPDTVLSTGIQTCRDLIDESRIDSPVGATAFWSNHGHEYRHPDPDGFYTEGGGPSLDMGPYCLTSSMTPLGPIRPAAGTANTSFAECEITNEPRRGEWAPVSVSTHETAVVTFEGGATRTFLASPDMWGSELSEFGIYDTERILSVTNPNRSGGTPRVHLSDNGGEWHEISIRRDRPGQQRDLGLVDPACLPNSDRDHRTSGDLGFHVPEVMNDTCESAEEGVYVELSAQCERPSSIPNGFPTDPGPAGDAE